MDRFKDRGTLKKTERESKTKLKTTRAVLRRLRILA